MRAADRPGRQTAGRGAGGSFSPRPAVRTEDLQLLATICLQVAVVLENASLHAERLRQQRLHQELAMARVQQGYLPHALEGFPDAASRFTARFFQLARWQATCTTS